MMKSAHENSASWISNCIISNEFVTSLIKLHGGSALWRCVTLITWSPCDELHINECAQVGILNVNGYYDTLLALFDKAVEDGFLSMAARLLLVSAPTATELIHKMEVSRSTMIIIPAAS